MVYSGAFIRINFAVAVVVVSIVTAVAAAQESSSDQDGQLEEPTLHALEGDLLELKEDTGDEENNLQAPKKNRTECEVVEESKEYRNAPGHCPRQDNGSAPGVFLKLNLTCRVYEGDKFVRTYTDNKSEFESCHTP